MSEAILPECISVFDIFKIGIGPSSSHTLGPWKAVLHSLDDLTHLSLLEKVVTVDIFLYGSLAKTGKGHGTDIALKMGLLGEDPVTTDVGKLNEKMGSLATSGYVHLLGKVRVPFTSDNIHFLKQEQLPFHPNALRINYSFSDGYSISHTYFSTGGGFIVRDGQENTSGDTLTAIYPVQTATELMHWTEYLQLPVSAVTRINEDSWIGAKEVDKRLLNIWGVMIDCIYKGCHETGILPGGLQVKRRAAEIHDKLIGKAKYSSLGEWKQIIREGQYSFTDILSWVSCFALSVNEQNASFGRVVTAPTNGAAGVIPAVLFYYDLFSGVSSDQGIIKFLLVAGELGSIFKKGSTISAAMGGCQAEIGVSSAMAAGALTECMGGTPAQVLMAAEIAMEHHLGLTCDPIGGLVQIPCIERNTMGAIKAITAAQIALQSDPAAARVSLDEVIKTMWDTAKDMNVKYKETAEGGLAINIPVNLPEC